MSKMNIQITIQHKKKFLLWDFEGKNVFIFEI